MLLRNKHSLIIWTLLSALAFSPKAGAGLYGHTSANPETYAETFLNQETPPLHIINYREKMRENLLMMINYAQAHNADFQILVHEGEELLTKSFWEYNLDDYNRVRKSKETVYDDTFLSTPEELPAPPMETLAYQYLHSIGGIALNNIYCGNNKESDISKRHNLGFITIENCADQNALDSAYISAMIDKKISYGFTSLADAFNNIGDHDSLNDSAKNIENVKDAQNILILIDDSRYATKDDLVSDLVKTNYDIIIINPLFANKERFSAEDLSRLHFKHNGSKRLLIAAMNVSEASPDDYFWDNDWKLGTPSWLVRPSFSSPNSIIVKYWEPQWQKIISRYFKDIVNEGFDGIFFTGIENYRYFEEQNPLE